MKTFYADINGKEYLMELHSDHVVSLLDLRTGYLNEFPFKNAKSAMAAFQTWQANSLPVIPFTFALRTDLSKDLQPLREELAKHDLTLPDTKQLKKWILYHGNRFIVMDDFDNKAIPEIDSVYLKRIHRIKVIRERNRLHQQSTPYGGLLEGVN